MAERCLKAARATTSFGPASESERAALDREAQKLSSQYGVPLAAWQLESMRDMEVALRARNTGVLAQRHGEDIARDYAAGDPVLAIARRYGLAPMATLRALLVENGHSEGSVRELMAHPSRLPPRLAAEAPAIFEGDLGSPLNADRKRAKAQAYEDRVGKHLRDMGLAFKTEADLRAEHEARQSREPLLTPDFLLTKPVLLDGHRVSWIDAKNYPLYGSRLVAKSLARQAEKYIARFGPGAMVFGGGLMCGADVLPAASPTRLALYLLDGSHLAAGAVTHPDRPG